MARFLSELGGLEPFDCTDSAGLDARWQRWLRAFELFATGKGVADPEQKKALLLHTAGMNVQDIYFTLMEETNDEASVYTLATRALNNYFKPQANVPYERLCFREMSQLPNETVDQFITRLRQKAQTCEFGENTAVDEQIRDQVISKCSSHNLRLKLLQKGRGLTLAQLKEIARAMEQSERQARAIEGKSEEVNKVTVETNYVQRDQRRDGRKGQITCFSCGREGHRSKDPKCPAIGKQCRKCQGTGHFERVCRTQPSERNKGGRQHVRQVEYDDDDQGPGKDKYAFSIHGSSDGTVNGRVMVQVGGIPIEMIIDSGASCNVVDRKLWEHLKDSKIQCTSTRSPQNLFPYGSKEPLTVAGKFTAQVSIGERLASGVDFIVIEEEGPALLGRDTAILLGVLKLGPEINALNMSLDGSQGQSSILDKHPNCCEGIGKLKDFQLKIPIDPEVTPVAQKMRRVPYHLRDKLSQKLDELVELDIIERVEGPSSWVSPVVVVTKSTGDIRLCVDMRQANMAVKRERYPIPTIDEVIQDMTQSKVFSKLDLKSAYHQIELAPQSRDITTSLPFFKKEKVRAVAEAREPTNAAEVRSFLGLVNFTARFIPDLATISAPLRKLTKAQEPFQWGPEQSRAFKELKRRLTNAETLGYFDQSAPTKVIADASPVGLGAVLVQEQAGELRVISYASRSLSDTEKRYSQTEKEALAIVWSCERFHAYIFGADFELWTDHKPLECIFTPKSKTCARIERWLLRLQPYTYTVKYIPGPSNIADSLSRLLSPSSVTGSDDTTEHYIRFVAREATPCALTTREMERVSEHDPELMCIRECLLNGRWDDIKFKEYLPVRNELGAVGQLVLRGARIVVPKQLRCQVLELAHEGHPGIVAMKQRLRSKVWWPGLDKEVEKHCKECYGCQLVSQPHKPEPMTRTELPSAPWEHLAADLLGPLPSGDYLFVVVDYYSRFFEIDFTKSITSEKIISLLDQAFVTHGLPLSLRTDNGTQFVSEQFEEYLRENGIEHRRTTPLWPQANGEVERQNRSILKRLRIAQVERRDWRGEMNKFLIMHRSTPHSTTGISPSQLLYGRNIRTKLPQLTETSWDYEVRDRDSEWKEKGKQYADAKRRAQDSQIQEGDQVLVKQERQNKLSTPFKPSPFTVIQKQGNSVLIGDGRSQYHRNVTHLKKFYGSRENVPEPRTTTSELDEIDPCFDDQPPGGTFKATTAVGMSPTQASQVDHPGQPCNPNLQATRPTRARMLPASDLYGAIGYPLKLARTVVVGKNAKLVGQVLQILSYFIRCTEVFEHTPERVDLPEHDFSHSDFTEVENCCLCRQNEDDPCHKHSICNPCIEKSGLSICSNCQKLIPKELDENISLQSSQLSRTLLQGLPCCPDCGLLQRNEKIEEIFRVNSMSGTCGTCLPKWTSAKGLQHFLDDLSYLERSETFKCYCCEKKEKTEESTSTFKCYCTGDSRCSLCSTTKNGLNTNLQKSIELDSIFLQLLLHDQFCSKLECKCSTPKDNTSCLEMDLEQDSSEQNDVESNDSSARSGSLDSGFHPGTPSCSAKSKMELEEYLSLDTLEDEDEFGPEELPLPGLVDGSSKDGDHRKPDEWRKSNNFGRSLFAGVGETYHPDFVLQGVTCNKQEILPSLSNDLCMALQHSVVDDALNDAVCIVADTDNWTCELISAKKGKLKSSESTQVQTIDGSNLVLTMLTSVSGMWDVKMPAEFCLMHLEDRLKEIYLKSRVIAEWLWNRKKSISQYELAHTLEIDDSDIVLLLAVASAHSPQGITYIR